MALMDVVRFNPPTNDWLVFKSPGTEFNTKSRLIVGPGQSAVCVYGGKIVGEFESGTHTLNSANLPFVKGLTKAIFGGTSPYQMEIYFFNKTLKLDFWWGITNGIQIKDPVYNVIIVIHARGQMGLRIVNKQFFLTQIASSFGGNLVSYSKLQDLFRGTINTKLKQTIMSYITNNNISALDLALTYEDVAEIGLNNLKDDFKKFGFELINLSIEALEPRKEDLVKINEILHKKAEFDIIGTDNYKTLKTFDVLDKSASNEGSGGAGLGMGIGLGVGAGQVASSLLKDATTKDSNSDLSKTCPKCHTNVPANSKFCLECGHGFVVTCPKCGSKVKEGMKFCSECGEKLGV